MTDEDLLKVRDGLVAELRRLRVTAGLSTTKLGEAAGWSQSKVSKIEHGQTRPTPEDVRRWCVITKAPTKLRELLAGQAAQIAVTRRTWRDALAGGAAARQEEMGRLENSASRAWILTPTILPGLMSTHAYAEAILRLVNRSLDAEQVSAGASARLARQGLLLDASKTWQFVIGEFALAYRPAGFGAEAVAEQRNHLLFMAGRPSVEVRVLPCAVDWPVLPFETASIYATPSSLIAVIESGSGETVHNGGDDAEEWRSIFGEVWELALTGDGALDMIRDRLV